MIPKTMCVLVAAAYLAFYSTIIGAAEFDDWTLFGNPGKGNGNGNGNGNIGNNNGNNNRGNNNGNGNIGKNNGNNNETNNNGNGYVGDGHGNGNHRSSGPFGNALYTGLSPTWPFIVVPPHVWWRLGDPRAVAAFVDGLEKAVDDHHDQPLDLDSSTR